MVDEAGQEVGILERRQAARDGADTAAKIVGEMQTQLDQQTAQVAAQEHDAKAQDFERQVVHKLRRQELEEAGMVAAGLPQAGEVKVSRFPSASIYAEELAERQRLAVEAGKAGVAAQAEAAKGLYNPSLRDLQIGILEDTEQFKARQAGAEPERIGDELKEVVSQDEKGAYTMAEIIGAARQAVEIDDAGGNAEKQLAIVAELEGRSVSIGEVRQFLAETGPFSPWLDREVGEPELSPDEQRALLDDSMAKVTRLHLELEELCKKIDPRKLEGEKRDIYEGHLQEMSSALADVRELTGKDWNVKQVVDAYREIQMDEHVEALGKRTEMEAALSEKEKKALYPSVLREAYEAIQAQKKDPTPSNADLAAAAINRCALLNGKKNVPPFQIEREFHDLLGAEKWEEIRGKFNLRRFFKRTAPAASGA